jgi:hypothetical protein
MSKISSEFQNLSNQSFICHWHKLEIIEAYTNWLLNFDPIRQDFSYSFEVNNEKCQIENCPNQAEIKLFKKQTGEITLA